MKRIYKPGVGHVSLDAVRRANEVMVNAKSVQYAVAGAAATAKVMATAHRIASTIASAQKTAEILVSATHMGKVYNKSITTNEMNDAFGKSLAAVCPSK